MKNVPNSSPAATAPAPGVNTILRFWACFFGCLVALGIVSYLMLAGFFLLMGYHVF